MSEQSLGGPVVAPTPSFLDDPTEAVVAMPSISEAATDPVTPLSLEEILDRARLPEKRVWITLRADLEAVHDEIVHELGQLVNAQGELLEDAEASLGEETAIGRARALVEKLATVENEMRGSRAPFLFRGMSSDELAVFNAEHYPANTDQPGAMNPYNNQLVARCAVSPELTVEGVEKLRKALGSRAILTLVHAATRVNVTGGVDVPKSPISSLGQKGE